ncbi:general transcription factor II-I repeat domain-containing protein 2A [Trichonephila clavipes]|nr:general transcription factor II-I repeat domain-containing protein 2A [Trichonephila clavipes]
MMLGMTKVVFSILLSGMMAIGRTMESGRRGYGASSGWKGLKKFNEKERQKWGRVSNRHFTTKHQSFSIKYPVGDAKKKAVVDIQRRQERSTSVFNYWVQSPNNVNMASFAGSQEIAQRGKPYTYGDYIKSRFISASDELFRDFKNKADI